MINARYLYLSKLKNFFRRIGWSFRVEKVQLLMYDDIYPHPVSGFRLEEFTTLLSEIEHSKIVLDPRAYHVLKTPMQDHYRHVADLVKVQTHLADKLIVGPNTFRNAKLFYCIFLSNILKNLKWLEKHSIPFVFTLYPGGGFKVEDEKTDLNLAKVFRSKMFRKVIVTQAYTKRYLLENNFCRPDQVCFIFGCVVPQENIGKQIANKPHYGLNKKTFDICFCAGKYSEQGKDKGYDVFIEFAHRILTTYSFVRFHIIGGFDKTDIDVSALQESIVFYGYQNFDDLKKIYHEMDIIISPNRPFILSHGAFDGFPLGTIVEAVLNGVVALVTDCLNENDNFTDDEDLIFIQPNAASIESKVMKLIENPNLLYSLSINGREKFSLLYSNQVQMKPRIELLNREISNS